MMYRRYRFTGLPPTAVLTVSQPDLSAHDRFLTGIGSGHHRPRPVLERCRSRLGESGSDCRQPSGSRLQKTYVDAAATGGQRQLRLSPETRRAQANAMRRLSQDPSASTAEIAKRIQADALPATGERGPGFWAGL